MYYILNQAIKFIAWYFLFIDEIRTLTSFLTAFKPLLVIIAKKIFLATPI